MSNDTIRETTLRELAQANSIRTARVVGQVGGWAVAVRYGRGERSLASSRDRDKARLFANLTTLATFLRGLGISRFEVDASHYAPGRVRPPRPDRAAALRLTRRAPATAPRTRV